MQHRIQILVLVVSLLANTMTNAREWTDTTGTFSTVAELVKVTEGTVELKKPNGKTIYVPLEKLSKTDQRWVESELEFRRKQAAISEVPRSTELSAMQQQLASDRAGRWQAQQTRIQNRKDECDNNVRQLRLEFDRLVAVRGSLVSEKENKLEEITRQTIVGGSQAETFSGALGLGILGGAASSVVTAKYDEEITTLNSKLSTIRKSFDEWNEELKTTTDLEIELAEWPKYNGHCYPVAKSTLNNSIANKLGIRSGDIYLSYNGSSLAYVSGDELNKARDEAGKSNAELVEVLLARNGKIVSYVVEGGKTLGIEVLLPIRK